MRTLLFLTLVSLAHAGSRTSTHYSIPIESNGSSGTAPATSADVSPFTRNPMRSAAICPAVPSPRITTSNASDACSVVNDPACARVFSASESAFGSALIHRSHEAFRQMRFPCNEGSYEAQQANALDILLDKQSALRPIRQIDDAHELTVQL